jgi:hypothetical protein
MTGTTVLERPGTRTPGTEARTDEGAEEEPRHRLMPLRIILDESEPEGSGHIVKYLRFHSGVDENRGAQNATMIDYHPSVLVRGNSLSEIETELLGKMPPYPRYIRGFVLSDEVVGYPVHEQGGTRQVTVRSANFCRLVEVNQEDIDREYWLEEQKKRT